MKFKITFQALCFLILLSIAACQKENVPELPARDEPKPGYEQYGTPFADIPQTQDIVMYEVNLRAFSATGDLQGVIDRLDHIQDLGVNVIWLMPIHPIG